MNSVNKKLLHNVFEFQAHATPAAVAIEEPSRAVTYEQLNQRANRLCGLLRSRGVKHESIVCTLLPTGIDLVSAILAIWKAGAIYVPMNVNMPASRNHAILERVKPELVLAAPGFTGVSTGATVYETGANFEEALAGFSPSNPALVSNPDDGNYIFFTSGSTSEPKAILGCHKSISHFIHWELKELGVDSNVRVSQLAQYTFDASLRDIFLPLSIGGTLCIPPANARDNLSELLGWLDRSRVSVVHTVPSLYRSLLKQIEEDGNSASQLSALKYLLLAGEPIFGRDIQRWRAIFGDRVAICNLYGATETTLVKTFHRIGELPADPAMPIHAGKPIANTLVLIIDNGRLCEPGETGEIFVKTPFATKGYFNDPQATAKVFVQNPLHNDMADIVYKTGDLGRYLPDHSLEVLGRIDNQIKLNGIRIEPGEIEHAILACPGVHQALVTVTAPNTDSQVLVCYFIGSGAEPESIRAKLAENLPAYLIPAYFIRLDQFPVNSNGKIDRKALPPPGSITENAVHLTPPANELEASIANIWKEILNLKSLSVTESFFEIGGQSLLAARIIARVYKQFQVNVKMSQFVQTPTVRGLADVISKSSKVTNEISLA